MYCFCNSESVAAPHLYRYEPRPVSNEGLETAAPQPTVTSVPESSSRQAFGQSLLWMGLVGLTLCLAIAYVVFTNFAIDPYTQAVLSLKGDASKGRSIFVMNCTACHGQWADGRVGPSLRGISARRSSKRIVHQVISGETPPMPQFRPEPQEMADLLSYLEKL